MSAVASASSAWEVFWLFVIPVGGGIPAGVLLAKSRGLEWPAMLLLYFLSDLALACVFEPLMLGFIWVGRKIHALQRFREAFKKSVQRSIAHYGTNKGPFALILIAFSVDPMTGRAAAVAAGYGFLGGWMIAITGDMFFFVLIMASTIWLKGLLGDGTWTTIIILVVMTVAPSLIRRLRRRKLTKA